jgi:hypothetical protein
MQQSWEEERERLRQELEIARNKATRAQQKISELERALEAVHRSRSWRITAPLRYLTTLVRRKAQ